MTAPDTSDRDAATQGDGAQMWRVRVDEPDEVDAKDVADIYTSDRFIAEVVVENYAPGQWCARGPEELTESCGEGATPREAVLRWVQEIAPWVAVEILAPGELSRAELVAAHADAIARAVAEEREACAAVCDQSEHGWRATKREEEARGLSTVGARAGAMTARGLAFVIRARGGAR